METRELLAPDAGPALGRSRGRVLALLRDAGTTLTVAAIARSCGLHPNTARFHLEALVGAGLAARDGEPGRAGTPGRPSVGYRAVGGQHAGGPPGGSRYRLLAEMLTSLVGELADDPAAITERAGREWGGYLTAQPRPGRRPSAAGALTVLAGLLADIGFDPRVEAGKAPGVAEVLLRECPFLEVAREHQPVVCSLHLGVIRGALEKMRAPLAADRLEVFPEPGLCRVRLSAAGKEEAREQGR